MSEINNTPDLNEAVEMVVEDAEVITTPIDDTLKISGAAADAAAVGAALAEKADKSSVKISVNGQEADNQGLILLRAEHIPMSEEPGAPTVRQAIEEMSGVTADEIPMSAEDETTVAERIEEVAEGIDGAVRSITAGGTEHTPDADGNVVITEVENAQQLISNKNEQTTGAFVVRPSSGYGSISDGEATLETLRGRSVHNGYVPEVLTMEVIPMPRPTPAGITAELDEETFEAYVEEAGTYTLSFTAAWSENPALYGVTVSGTPESGDTITITWDGENEAVMTVSSPREPEAEITATINKAAFRAAVSSSTTVSLVYTTGWSSNPANYGITVTGTPIAGDQITVTYVKEERGTIVNATPTALVAVGWNLYNPESGMCRCCRYSETYGYRIGGAWTKLEYSATVNGARVTITPADGLFNVPGDGWLHVTGGDGTTFVYTTWSDWVASYEGEMEAYAEARIDLSAVMANFPAGLCRIGNVADYIDLTRQEAISNIQRVPYTEQARAAAEGSGLGYDFDEDYVYTVRALPVSYSAAVGSSYAVSEHGLEYFEGTNVGPEMTALYGVNLKDKLERNVAALDMTLGELMGRA